MAEAFILPLPPVHDQISSPDGVDNFLLLPEQAANLDQLAESTRAALEVLMPWYQMKTSFFRVTGKSNASMLDIAKSYARAIHSSVLASQLGYTLADEVLTYSQLHRAVANSRDSERKDYLEAMSKIAAEGTKVANRSANEFGEVHSTVNSLIRTYGVKKSKKAELANNIEVLEKLGDSVKAYAKWWNQMHMLQTSTERRLQAGYGALRKKALEAKWVELKGEYEQYTGKIRSVEADYPTIFSQEFRTRTLEGTRRLDLKTMTLGQKIKVLWGSSS